MPSVYCTWARKWAPRLSCASVGIIFTMGYANNVPVNLNEYKSWFFCDYIQTWQWPTRKPRLLWPLVHILSRFPFINWIVHFCEKIIYSVCVRLIHLNSANKVEKLKSLNYLSFCKTKKINKITVFRLDLKETFSPTSRIIVNVFPGWSVSLASCCMVGNSCLFSSQLPLLFSPKDSLKFVEVHHECLKHAWLHDTRLDGWIFNIAWLAKRLFCLMMKLADLEFSSFATIVVTKLHKNSDQIIFSCPLNCSPPKRFVREELLRKSCWFVALQYINLMLWIKAGYPLTSITWPHCGLRCRPVEVEYFLKLSSDKLLTFKWSQAQVYFF